MLGRLFKPATEERAQPYVVHGPDFWGIAGGAMGRTLGALRNAAVWACIDVLASSVAGTPLDVVRQQGRARQAVSPTPSLIAAPSGMVTTDVWLYQVMWSILNDGNAFGKVTAVDVSQRPTSIETIHPDLVVERKTVDGVLQARVDGTVMKAYPFGDLWHVPGKMVVPGSPLGLSPVEYAAAAIDAGLSAEEFGLRFFTDGGHPSSIISSTQDLNEKQAKAIKAAFKNATSGNREPAVFGAGLKYEQVSVNPNDSQFIELQRFTVEQVCRYFRVPPAMVYAATSGQSVTYANANQADMHYLKHSLDGYLVRLENAMTALLPRPQLVRFNRNALLRSDAKSRYEVHALALKNKVRSVNEVRALEDEPPFAGKEFDEPGIPGGAPADDKPPPTEDKPA